MGRERMVKEDLRLQDAATSALLNRARCARLPLETKNPDKASRDEFPDVCKTTVHAYQSLEAIGLRHQHRQATHDVPLHGKRFQRARHLLASRGIATTPDKPPTPGPGRPCKSSSRPLDPAGSDPCHNPKRSRRTRRIRSRRPYHGKSRRSRPGSETEGA